MKTSQTALACAFLASAATAGAGEPVPYAHPSSVDGETLTGLVWSPTGVNPATSSPRPLVIFLHGGGGNAQTMLNTANGAFTAELDARGWFGLSPDGRRWGIATQGCPNEFSFAYVDSDDPDVGPGEQDILDSLDFAIANYPIDADRIYLAGFSMGGRGAYIIGLRNPDLFAAIGPMAPASDMFDTAATVEDPGCLERIVGGPPLSGERSDTYYSITSARFLIENAYNLPVYHGHGLDDGRAFNREQLAGRYLHGWHMVNDTSWSGCSDGAALCFGHTPTLSELRDRHPDGYEWAYMFTDRAHSVDPLWLQGATPGSGRFGTPDPLAPSQLEGMFDFFERHVLQTNPARVVFKTYTDQHRRAYWLELDSATPWRNLPAAARATPSPSTNALTIELARAARVGIDLARTGLRVAEDAPLTIDLQPLADSAYDPNLDVGGLSQSVTLDLHAAPALAETRVLRDGVDLPASSFSRTGDTLTLANLTLTSRTVLTIGGADVAPTQVPDGDSDDTDVPDDDGTGGGGFVLPPDLDSSDTGSDETPLPEPEVTAACGARACGAGLAPFWVIGVTGGLLSRLPRRRR